GGGSTDAYVESVGSADPPRQIVRELETHLRAILRDVLCGYLDVDLKGAADDIILASGEPVEIRARDLRRPSIPRTPASRRLPTGRWTTTRPATRRPSSRDEGSAAAATSKRSPAASSRRRPG